MKWLEFESGQLDINFIDSSIQSLVFKTSIFDYHGLLFSFSLFKWEIIDMEVQF